jgi:hypothetical protein
VEDYVKESQGAKAKIQKTSLKGKDAASQQLLNELMSSNPGLLEEIARAQELAIATGNRSQFKISLDPESLKPQKE